MYIHIYIYIYKICTAHSGTNILINSYTHINIYEDHHKKNIKNTDRMVYTNEENTLIEITSESIS